MFDLKEIKYKVQYPEPIELFLELYKLLVFFERTIYGNGAGTEFIPETIQSIVSDRVKPKNYYQMMRQNAYKKKIFTSGSEKYISYYVCHDYFFWTESYRVLPNKENLHEIRKLIVANEPKLYCQYAKEFDVYWENLTNKSFHRKANYLFISDILMRLYANIPFEVEFDISLLFPYIPKSSFTQIGREFIDIGLDRNLLQNMNDTNLKLLHKILNWIAKTGYSSQVAEAIKLVESIGGMAKCYDAIASYFKEGITESNSKEPLVLAYESFFTGDFEKALGILKDYRKNFKKEKGFDIDTELFCMLQICRSMQNKDISILQKEVAAEIKRQESLPAHEPVSSLEEFSEMRLGKRYTFVSEYNKILEETLLGNVSSIAKITPLSIAKMENFAFSPAVIKTVKMVLENVKKIFPYLAKCLYPTFASVYGPELDVFLKDPKFFDFSQKQSVDTVWQTKLEAIKDILKLDKVTNTKTRAKGKTTKLKNEKHLAWIFSKDSKSWYPRCCVVSGFGFGTPDETVEVTSNDYSINNFLSGKSSKHNYVSDQDQNIALTYDREPGYRRNTYDYVYTNRNALPTMIGHPYVYCLTEAHRYLPEFMIHMDVLDCKPELCIVEEKSHLLVQMNVGEHVSANTGYTFDVENRKILVYKLDKNIIQIYELLDSSKGFKFPKESLQELIALGKSSDLSVKLDIESQKVTGTAKPVMKLDASGKIYSAQLRFKHIDNPLCPLKIPGLGEASLYFKPDNSPMPIVVDRDLSLEKESAHNIVNSLSAIDCFMDEGEFSYSTENLEDLLKLLQELKAREKEENIPEIMWADNKKYNVAGSITNGKFGLKADISANDYLTITGNVELDEGRYLSLRSLLASIKESKGNFVKIDDENYVAVTSELKSRLEKINALTIPGKNKDELRSHPLAEEALESVIGDIQCEFGSNVTKLIEKRTKAMKMVVSVPKTLQADLRSYQKDGYTWLYRLSQWGVGACLADDMGLGKTVQTIALMLKLASEGPVVIVAPTSVCPNWQMELYKFAPSLNVKRLKDADSRVDMVSSMNAGDVLIVSYGLFAIESDILSNIKWRLAIFDEAQALKNSDTQRAKTATRINAGMRIALTGTPIENSLDDLWSIFNIINPGLLGTSKEFHSRFSGIENDKNTSRMLKLLLSPFILRRLKGDVLDDLPPRTEQIIYVESTEREKALYETMRIDTLEELEKNKLPTNKNGQRRLQILSALTRLRQMCCDPAIISNELKSGDSSKTKAFEALLDEALSGGHRLLVFSQFVGYLSRVKALLERKKIDYKYLDGQTPEKARAKAISEFQTGLGDVFLISLKAGGQGLNLTSADYVVHLDPWWNPAVEDQATDRAYRIGQTRPVNVFRFAIKDSLEEKILELHAQKRELAADFLEGTASVAGEAMKLSEEELLALIG